MVMINKQLISDILLFIGAAIVGFSGEVLDNINLLLGIALKAVSIVSFIILIILNWKKIKNKLK